MARPEGDTIWYPPSFLLSPILPLQYVQFVNLYNIEKSYILSLNSSFHLPISWCLLSTPPPKKNIKVGPILRIILVPPLSSVNLRRECSQRGSGLGGLSSLSQKPTPLEPQIKWKFLQGSMESRQFEFRSASAPVGAPSFWKGWLRPS